MKTFQQNLLIVLALALCGLCAWQWYFQTDLRQTIQKRDDTVFKLSSDVQGYTNSINAMTAEIDGLQAQLAELKRQAASNHDEILEEKRQVIRLRSDAEIESNEISQYQEVTNLLTTQLLTAYDGVKKQNEAIQKLVAQRDEFVEKYNQSVQARNELTDRYNGLVDRINKLQAAAAK